MYDIEKNQLMKIIGIEKKSGTFNEKPYLNYAVYIQKEPTAESRGILVNTLKVSQRNMDLILKDLGANDPFALVGFEFQDILFDAYRNPVRFC